MAYCRFSSNCYRSDFYIYEDQDSILVFVAGRRIIKPVPERINQLYKSALINPAYVVELHTETSEWYKSCCDAIGNIKKEYEYDLRLIDKATAGGAFRFDTLGECAIWIEKQLKLGFIIPDVVLAQLYIDQKLSQIDPKFHTAP